MVLTLSQIQAATWSHLDSAANHWNSVADTYEEVWTGAKERVADLAWTGAGQEGALAAHTADLTQAQGHAETLRTAATAARTGHGNLTAMKQQLMAEVQEAKSANYQVSEALTVTPPPNAPIWQQAVMAPDAARRTAQLQARAAAIAAYDAEVGAQVAAPAASFAASSFPKPPGFSMMSTGFKTDTPDIAPPDMPDPVPKSPIPQLQQTITSGPAPMTAAPPMPRYTGHPPEMRAAPPGPPFDPAPQDPNAPAEKNPDPGAVVSGITAGCAGGSGIAAAIAVPVPPAEIAAPEIGCVSGAVVGASGALLTPWLDNLFHGLG